MQTSWMGSGSSSLKGRPDDAGEYVLKRFEDILNRLGLDAR